MKVLLCGGGNAIHVLTSYVGSKPDCEVSVLTLYPGEADRFRAACPDEGVQCQNDLGPDVYGKPKVITDDPSKLDNDIDVVIMALPALFHQAYLEALKPYLRRGVVIGAMPGQSGFDLCARHILGDDFVSASNLFSLETLPWACRILEYGKVVEVLGTKKEIDLVITKRRGETSVEPVRQLLQKLMGELPVLKPAANFLAVTLQSINSVWHPTISYAYYHDKDVTKPMDDPPLFYYGASEYTGDKLDKVSNEVLQVKSKLLEKYGEGLDLSCLTHVRDWMLKSYGDDIGDKTNLYTMLITNKGYRGLTHPTITVETDEGQYLPLFEHRYFSEDLPCGLIVTRGIAELTGVPTPHMDDVINWAQKCMGKEYLVDGKLCGADVVSTRSPQRYGFKDLDTFIKANHYVE